MKEENNQTYWYKILDNLLEGVWIEDSEGKITFVNARLLSMCGYDTSVELLGKPRSVLTTLQEPRLSEPADITDSRFTCETLLKSRDGGTFAAVLGITPLLHDSEHVGRLYSVLDLRDRKRLENEVRRTANRFRDLMENSADGICIVENNSLRLFNQRLEELTGYSRDELRRASLTSLIVPRDQAQATDALDPTGRFLTSSVTELSLLTKDGKELDIELKLVPIEYENRSALLCFMRDLTCKKELEKMKTEFVATVSHELRTPLAMIKEAVSLLSEGSGVKLEGPALRFLNIAHEEINRLNRMIDNLLEISRMESIAVRLRVTPVRVNELIDRVLTTLQVPIRQKNLTVVKHLPEGGVTIHADEDRLFQVLCNLLDNAIKFNPAGGKITITVERLDADAPLAAAKNLPPNEGYLKISVADNGPGIPTEALDRIFRKFERVTRGGMPAPKGIGLGLAIAANIVNMHGGRIWARSEEGNGSEFIFILPSRPVLTR